MLGKRASETIVHIKVSVMMQDGSETIFELDPNNHYFKQEKQILKHYSLTTKAVEFTDTGITRFVLDGLLVRSEHRKLPG